MSQDIETSSGLSTEEIIAILGVLLLSAGFILYYLWPSNSNPLSDFNNATAPQVTEAPAMLATAQPQAPASTTPTSVSLSGQAEPGQRYDILINGEKRGTTTTNSAGKWEYQAQTPTSGKFDIALKPLALATAAVEAEPVTADIPKPVIAEAPEIKVPVIEAPAVEVAEVKAPVVEVAKPIAEIAKPVVAMAAAKIPEINVPTISTPEIKFEAPTLAVAEPQDPSQRVLEISEPRTIPIIETTEVAIAETLPATVATIADLHELSPEEVIVEQQIAQQQIVEPIVEQQPAVIEQPVALAKVSDSLDINTGAIAPPVVSAGIAEPSLEALNRNPKNGELTVTGQTETPNQSLILLINGIHTEALQSNGNGTWNYTFRAAPGEYYIRAMNIDEQGRRTSTDQLPKLYNISLTDSGATASNNGASINPLNGQYHAVKSGETLFSIAKANGLTSGDLMMINGLETPQSLKAGATLFIPQ